MANLTLQTNDNEVKTFAISSEEEENISNIGQDEIVGVILDELQRCSYGIPQEYLTKDTCDDIAMWLFDDDATKFYVIEY